MKAANFATSTSVIARHINIYARVLACALLFTAWTAVATNAPDGPAAGADPTIDPGNRVEWHNEGTDTTRITRILIDEAQTERPGRVSRIGMIFAGTPYGAHTLEGEQECLRVNLDSMDCTTFVETVAALAMTARERRQSWQDFLYNLERLRYRNGVMEGYPSRLHYVSAWILDNQARGLLNEVTGDISGSRYMVKSLDYMSRHSGDYPALSDSVTLGRMRSVEAGYSNHRYPYLRSSQCSAKLLREAVHDGDIIAFTTAEKGLDVSHLGIAAVDEKGDVRLLHASSKGGKVMVDPLPLADYIRRNRPEGIRIIRLAE